MPASTPYFAVVPRHTLPTLSCVIPCYNEAANLRLLLPLLAEQLAQCSRQWK